MDPYYHKPMKTPHQAFCVESPYTDPKYVTYEDLLTLSSCVADILSSGFLTKHLRTKSLMSGDHFSGFLNVGGGFVGIMKMA